jgi:DNA-binding transcriptional ArsR family regulator
MAETVELQQIARRGLRPFVDVHASAVFLAVDAMGGEEDEPLAASIRSALTPAHRAALTPMAQERVLPDVVLAGLDQRELPARDRLVAVATADPAVLLADLASGPWIDQEIWQPVVRSPERWLRVVADATARVWPIARALLAAERPALRRLGARIRQAHEPQQVAEVIELVDGRTRVTDGQWELRPHGEPATIPDEGLFVVPVLTTRDGSLAACQPGLVTALFGGVSTRTRDHWALEALLSPVRARVLRLLDEPQTMTALGERLGVVPSVATHHVAALERAGLVQRRREGRFVHVARTDRGDELLRTYAIAPLGPRRHVLHAADAA